MSRSFNWMILRAIRICNHRRRCIQQKDKSREGFERDTLGAMHLEVITCEPHNGTIDLDL